MIPSMPMKITHLSDLKQCDAVFALYRGDSGTLGWMPKGAFAEGIMNRRLLVAIDQAGRFVGYLLYRVVGRRATIAHLCVSKEVRGKGVAASLVTALKEHTSELDGITLKCRNDFDAHRFWPRMGFVAKGSARGRGADRAELTVWHVDHGHPDLFSVEPAKTRVVIDANVFFDLWAPDRPKREVSGALTEPWVEDTVELVLTPEIYNDIQRAGTAEERDRSKSMVGTFGEVRPPSLEVDRIVPHLRASNISFCAPGLILWYVSQGNEKLGSMEVKACSRLREVVKAGPKQLFKRFRRLGVYAWKDIYSLADSKVESELTALRFSHTERFLNPQSVAMLSTLGVPPPYPGPRPITHSTFVSIYNQALPFKA
jgi:GNAT superfamily N-acetyltransferase